MHTVREVAEMLGVGESTVYQLVASGKLGSHRIGVGRGTIRIAPADLEAYLASTRSAAPSVEAAVPRRTKLKHIRL